MTRATATAFVGALVLCAGACDGGALDTVRVCGDISVPRELVAIRVTVLSIGVGELKERTGGAVVLTNDEGADRQLPVEVAVAAVSGQRVFRVQALGPDDSEVGRADVLVGGSPDEAIVVNLSRACLGFDCPLGQTCEEGACVITPAGGSGGCLSPGPP